MQEKRKKLTYYEKKDIIKLLVRISLRREYHLVSVPDGELFIGPDLNTSDGEILFNVPTRYQGNQYEELYLKFKNGKVVDYNSKNNSKKLEKLNKMKRG